MYYYDNPEISVLKQHWPHIYRRMCNICPKEERVGQTVFASTATNIHVAIGEGSQKVDMRTLLHTDVLDAGLAALFPMGSFQDGGEVTIPQLSLALKLEEGDCVFMQSKALYHRSLSYCRGRRSSLVLNVRSRVPGQPIPPFQPGLEWVTKPMQEWPACIAKAFD
jgi:hypothetical protein